MDKDEAVAAAALRSLIPADRLRMMLVLCGDLPAGCIVQCGVFQGGSAALLAWLTGKDLWLFDRFCGMPKPEPIDGEKAASKWRPDWCAATIPDVAKALAVFDVPSEQVRIIGGDFADTLWRVETGPVALLHVDADWYASTRLALERFLPEMGAGGVVIVDDYHHWPGCKAAVDELDVTVNEMDGTAVWWRA
jgi:O-methyltransferase